MIGIAFVLFAIQMTLIVMIVTLTEIRDAIQENTYANTQAKQ